MSPYLMAQPDRFFFERFTTLEGLPNTTILDIAQDHDGYIWLATQDGLVRFDGYEFVNYRNIPGDTTSLSENRIEALFIDSQGDIWIGTPSGVDRYNAECDCIKRFGSNESLPNIQQTGQFNTFGEDRNQNIWIGTQEGGLFRYDRKTDEFTRFLDDPQQQVHLLEDEVRVLLTDKNNNLWIGTGEPFDATVSGGGLIRLDLQTLKAKRFLHDPADANSLLDNRVSALFEDRDGKLWIGTCQSGLHYYDPRQEEITRMMPTAGDTSLYAPQGEMGLWSSCPHVRFIHQDQDGNFWVGTYNGGINYFDAKRKQLTQYRHSPADPASLSSDQVWAFLEDKQERIWVGNLPGGLHMVDPSLHKFKLYKHDAGKTGGLSNDQVMGAYATPEQADMLWIETRGGGLNLLDLKNDHWQYFRHRDDDPYSIGNDHVWTTFEDSQGTFWVGTEAGLDILDRQTGKFTAYQIRENDTLVPVPFPVISIHEDRAGDLWLGTWSGGMIRLDKDRSLVNRYQFSNSSQQTYYNSVYVIHEDQQGTIWAGIFQDGLFEYDPEEDQFVHHLQGFGINSLLEDSTGNLWVGTGNGGLLHYNPADDTYQQYNVTDGLPSDAIYGLLMDEQRRIWLSSENGIACFEPETGQARAYGSSDGLPFTSFSYTSSFKNTDGQLYFGGTGGLVSFYPMEVKGNPYPPDIVLKGLQIAGEGKGMSALQQTASSDLELTHQQNDLTFNYVGLHFTKPSGNIYKYRMLPYDEDWIHAGTQQTARYTNLDPGEYTFQVTARSSDGVWNEEGASLHFFIAPPWWTRWWAYVLFASLLMGIGYRIYRFQLSRKLAISENMRLNEVNQLKSSLYTNITHEFRTPLTVILGIASDLQNSVQDMQVRETHAALRTIQRNGKKLLHLVNEMLDLAKLESGNMELNLVQADVVPFVRYLVESFYTMARAKQIALTLYSEIDTLVMDFDTDKLSSVVANLLSNAIKFTDESGKVIVHLKQVSEAGEDFFFLKVKDNGSGISPEFISKIFDRFYQVDGSSSRKGEGTGIGLALTQEFVTLMGGQIAVKSTLGKGSEFTIRIPVRKHAEVADAQELNLPYYTDATETTHSVEVSNLSIGHHEDLPLALIVEDNLDVADYLRSCLSGKYQTLHAVNGQEGIAMAAEKMPDIIICDVMMPGKDGFEVCAYLKTDPRTDHIPIVMLTAKATMKDRITGIKHGADAYLNKPFVKAELFTRLDQLVLARKKMLSKFENGGFSQILKKSADNPEAKFLQKAISIVNQHISESEFGGRQLAYQLHMSESQLYRKLKAVSGKSTALFIRSVRLQKARELLLTGEASISKVAYEVGFNDPSWFSRAFKKEFGFAPSETVKHL